MTGKKPPRHESLAPKPLKGWRAEAFKRWKQGDSISVLAKDYRAERSTIFEMIQRGKDAEQAEIRERMRQVQGPPLIPLPPYEKKMEACRLFASGTIDITEFSKRLRGG